jgi:protein-tyrosine phosphatase
MKILMVCLGNICRSPIAEGIMKEKIKARNLDWFVDSAGTSNWHQGETPDRRSMQNALQHNIDISNQRSRQFTVNDFEVFDIIFAMDTSNLNDLQQLALTQEDRNKLNLLLQYAGMPYNNVPDPYTGGADMFEKVFQLVDEACTRSLNKLMAESFQ